MSARSMPTSRVTPTPKRTLDTAISNAMSLLMTTVNLKEHKAIRYVDVTVRPTSLR